MEGRWFIVDYNILFIIDVASICFKLTDFGASRELQTGEEFMSYYGTEEYLVSVPIFICVCK